jgi:hypothetical protein
MYGVRSLHVRKPSLQFCSLVGACVYLLVLDPGCSSITCRGGFMPPGGISSEHPAV